MTPSSTAFALLAVLFVVSATNVVADVGNPCASDARKLCPDTKPGHGEVARCLERHASELSPACRQYGADRKTRTKTTTVAKACSDDAGTHCAGIAPGDGRIAQCLMKHRADLSSSCQQALDHVAR